MQYGSEQELRMVAEPGPTVDRAPALKRTRTTTKFILTFALILSVVLSMAAPTPSLIDTKLLGRPKGYSGNRGEWGQW